MSEDAYSRALAFYKDGHLEQAAEAAKTAVGEKPGDPERRMALGSILLSCHDEPGALAQFQFAAMLAPDAAHPHYRCGHMLERLGRSADAEVAYRKALTANEDHVDAMVALAECLIDRRAGQEAAPLLSRALELQPGHARGQAVWGKFLHHDHRFIEAEIHGRKALALDSQNPAVLSRLASTVFSLAKPSEARALYEQALQARKGALWLWSAYLFTLLHDPGASAAETVAAHAAVNAIVPPPDPVPFEQDKDPARRLNIGYLSPDFWDHPVAFFFRPLLAAHDRARFSITCYADIPAADGVSARLAADCDRWREVRGMDTDALVRQIRDDRIDILIDMAGHAGGRMEVFARKPAPLQLSWLGYLGGTGLRAIDGRISDALADPGDLFGQDDPIIRLPDRPFLAFDIPADAPPVPPLPCRSGRPVTFGSFNKLGKLNDAVIALWARVLDAVPQSRLLLKSAELNDPGVREQITDRFKACGVAPERLELLGYVRDHAAHMALYDRIDIALDPFPWNGGTTTVEALIMGRPVITLAEPERPFRMGAGLLGYAGLKDLIARTQDDYVAATAALAGDPDRLEAFSVGMRARLASSPLTDATGLAEALEVVYRRLWRQWCGAEEAPGSS